jgi:Cu/Ag efflux pump CusA
VINVEANTEGAALSEVVNAATARIEQNVKFPAGYGLSQGGQTKDQQESSPRCCSRSASR